MKAVKGYKSLYIANNGIYKIRIAVLPLVQKFYYTPKKINHSLRTKDSNKAKDEYYRLIAKIERKCD